MHSLHKQKRRLAGRDDMSEKSRNNLIFRLVAVGLVVSILLIYEIIRYKVLTTIGYTRNALSASYRGADFFNDGA